MRIRHTVRMLTPDNYTKHTLVYDQLAAPVIPYDLLPPIEISRMPLALEYQARHVVIGGYAVGKVLLLNPKRTKSGAPRNVDARVLDDIINISFSPLTNDNPMHRIIRQRVDASLASDTWLDLMLSEDKRAIAEGVKPPALSLQPQSSRHWLEALVKRARAKQAYLKRKV